MVTAVDLTSRWIGFPQNHEEIILKMEPKFHWLVAGTVTAVNRTGKTNVRSLNVMLTTHNPEISRIDLAKAQEGMCRRFVSETEQIPGFKIADAFILSISALGFMTEQQFNAGFENKPIDQVVS